MFIVSALNPNENPKRIWIKNPWFNEIADYHDFGKATPLGRGRGRTEVVLSPRRVSSRHNPDLNRFNNGLSGLYE